MFDSKSLLSSKGPLGAIWVAAYFFKKLKKAQVLNTNISFSVDKLIQDESQIITYRVLGYLLLGIVRVFSRKTDYLFEDCNEVMFRINDFIVKTKKKPHSETMQAPGFSLTLPKKFELDTFDLEIHEDSSSDNVLPNEDITLKDVESGSEEKICSLSTYHCEETYAGCSTYSTNYTLVEDCIPSGQMDVGIELQTSNDIRSLKASVEKEQENRFTQEECMDLEMFCVVEEQPLPSIKPYGKDYQASMQEIKDPEISQSEIVEEEGSIEKLRDSSFEQEKGVSLLTSCGIEGEHPEQNKISNNHHQIDEDEMFVSEFTMPVKKSSQVMEEDQDVSNFQTEMETLPDCTESKVMFEDLDTPYRPNEPLELDMSYGKENLEQREQRSQEMISSDKRKCHMAAIDYPVSITLDVTPLSNEPDATDTTTPQFMEVPTPAAREPFRFSRKRKSLIDDITVLTNEVMGQSINDASDLVSKRRKVPLTASLAARQAFQIRNLSHGFFDSLVPGLVQELKSCFCNKKLKIMEFDKTVQPPEKLQVSVSPCPSKPEQIAIAPQTPVQSTTLMKSFESPWSPWSPKALDHDQWRPEQFESIEKEVRSAPFENVEKELSLFRDDELELNWTDETNEEIKSCSGYSHDLHFSGRTRVVVRYLYDSFLNKKKQGQEEVVNLLQVLEGNTKKTSAGFFYEILVLKTKGYVNVKEDYAYGDILVQKLPKWEEICEDGRF